MQRSKRTNFPQLRALALAVQAAWGWAAWALPQGATVVNGQVSIAQPAAGSMQIAASNGAIINWKQFSIGSGEITRFLQPSNNSAVLNRVTGADPSLLLGQLKSNGQVFLINPYGLVIGSGARIDTNGFIGSTLNITDADFLAGKLRFAAGASAGRIRNAGVISGGAGGRVALIAPDIENRGIIQAADGSILLAAGRKLEIGSLDLDGVTFEIQAPIDSVLNLGQLLAENGVVQAFAGTLRQSGEIRANRLVQDSDGRIVLAGSHDVTLTVGSETRADGAAGGSVLIQSSGGAARVAGEVSATGAAAAGGDIRVLGQQVALESGARLDASGRSGGGQILVGGDFQGKNAEVQNAQRVYVASGAELKADATGQGDGGRVIVWADENTRYYGSLSAQGGVGGGDGGFAEVSGKQNLQFAGFAKLGAAVGASGSLLLDPLDIIISSTSGILPTVVDEFGDFSSNVVTVSPAALAAVGGSVKLQAGRDIYIKSAITLTANGAGLSATAGGVAFDAGSIYNQGGISTTGGAVTLRAETITGAGGISTAGGAVDLLTSSALGYGGAIQSGGGTVTLASQGSTVYGGLVDAGSGTLNVIGQNGVSGGSYASTGTVNLIATTGGISGADVSAGVANLIAVSGVNASVDVTDRVNATSTASSVQLDGAGIEALRLGTLSSISGLYLSSSTGFAQASGGLLTTPFVNFHTNGSSASTGTVAAPILIAASMSNDTVPVASKPRISVFDMAAPAHFAFSGSPTIGGLSLQGTVAALGASTVDASSSANLSSLTLSASTGVLSVAAVSSAGFGNGFQLDVTDGAVNAPTLTLPGGHVDLTANGAVTVGTMSGDSLSINAKGAVVITSATTTGSDGIHVSTRSCDYDAYAGCTASSPITAGTLNAGSTGDVRLATYDNGDISVSGSLTGRSADLRAGDLYYTSAYPYYYSQRTSNAINVASATTGNAFSAQDNGHGDIALGRLASSGFVNVSAGGTYRLSSLSYPYYTEVLTNNDIFITNAEPAAASGSFQVYNSGIGNVSVTGAINRPSGGVSLSAQNGSVTAGSNHSASASINVIADSSVTLGNLASSDENVSVNAGTTLTVGQVTAGSISSYYDGNVDLTAGGDLSFSSITVASNGYYSYYGSVNLSSGTGTIQTTVANTTADVSAVGSVTMTANDSINGAIGNAAFAHPMDIKAGASGVVTLSAGKDIGAVGKAVTVDTSGTLNITSAGGQFHVAATDGTAEKSLTTIRLSASAAGIGSGNAATFTSADLDVTAASDGSTLTIGDLVRATGTLNEFKFAATGISGLIFGDVDLTTTGYNQLLLSAANGLTQTAPVTAHNINAGYISLAGGGGAVTVGNVAASNVTGNRVNISGADITTGDISAPSLTVEGTNLSLGVLATTGTHRGYYTGYDFIPRLGYSDYVLDELTLTASGDIITSGGITSLTSALITGGGNVTVAGGAGTVTAGNTTICCTYYTDMAKIWAGTGAGNTLSAGNVSGYNLDLKGHSVQVADLTAVGSLNVSGTDLDTGNASAVYATLAATNLLATGSVSGTYITLTGDAFNTGNVSATGNLTVTSSAAYAPSNVALTVGGAATINAVGDISLLANNGTTLTAPNVSLKSSAGNVAAELTGTRNLSIDTAAGFAVSSDTWLDNLNITAQWDKAANTGAGSVGATVTSSTASGSQSFDYGFDGPLYMNVWSSLDAGRSWNLTYHDVSANSVVASPTPSTDDVVSASLSHAGGGTFRLAFDSATVLGNVSASLGLTSTSSTSGHLQLETGGDIYLADVRTNGGNVTATSHNGDVTFHAINTSAEGFAGNVSLTSDNGNIELQVDLTNAGPAITASSFCNVCTAPLTVSYGTISLSAPSGSVGAAGAIPINFARGLYVSARDTINVSQANGLLTSLSLVTPGSGTGSIAVSDANFAGFALTRNAGDLELAGVNPTQLADFGLTATDGRIIVKSDIGNVAALTLNAGYDTNTTADLLIQASGGARVVSASSYDLRAGHDILITAGKLAGENVSVTASGSTLDSYVYARHDIQVAADAGSAILGHGASGWTQSLNAGHDLLITGGSSGFAGSSAALTTAGHQQLNVGHDLLIQAGSADGAFAKVEALQNQNASGINNLSVLGGGNNASASLVGASQSFANVQGLVTVQGGTGTNASARIEAMTGSQTLGDFYYGTADQVLVQGGSNTGASAAIRAAGSQSVYSDGDIKVLGGSVSGTDAEILSASGNQTIGATYIYYSGATQNVLVQAGAGGAARIKANGSQNVQGGGNISVLGGSGAGTTASIETTGGSQSIGGAATSYSYNDPTVDILIQGGTGSGAAASVKASGQQNINAGGSISVLGNAGPGADAEIVSTAGGQQIGSTIDAYYNDATGAIAVQAGSGGVARIQAFGSQTIMTGGDLSVIGGGAANMTAAIESTGGSQTIGSTNLFSNDPSANVLVQAGVFSGAAAWIRASTGQTIDAGGTITLAAGAGGALAEMRTAAGSQNIGNLNHAGSYDQTDSISLTGGTAAGAYARIESGGSQTVNSAADISLTGGVGANSGAQLMASTGQILTAFGNLRLLGGTGSGIGLQATAIRNSTSGNQSLAVSGDMTVTGGAGVADTWIYQVGSGVQTMTVGGNLALNSDASNVNVTSIEAIGVGGQTIHVGGAIAVDNKAGWHVNITSSGAQTITADSLAISMSSSSGANPYAGVYATGNQNLTLNGVNANADEVNDAGTATLFVVNQSPSAGSLTELSSGANQTILMDYDAAGLVQIGDVAGQGVAKITAGATHTMVAGSLLIQGGAGVGSNASLEATGNMALSTLYGPVELKGGTNGSAFIDPPLLNVASNGSVSLLAGSNATANASITAGIFNLAATTGNLNLTNSAAATATIAATTFNFTGAGNVNLTGGTITGTAPSTINITGLCNNCSTNLFGPFSVTAFVPAVPLSTNFSALVANDILMLAQIAGWGVDAYIDENGYWVLTSRRLNQCY